MNRTWVVCILFLFIYNVPFTFFPVATGKLVLLFSLFLLFLVKSDSLACRTLFRDLKVISPFSLIIALFFCSAFINFIHGTRDYTFIYTYFLFLVEYYVGGFIVIYFLSLGHDKNMVNGFLNSFVISSLIQSVRVYCMLFIPTFRSFSFGIIDLDAMAEVNERYGGLRGLSYASSVTYDFSVLQSLALIFIPYLLVSSKSLTKIIFYTFAYLFILGTILISGRTGFIGVGISIFLFFFHSFSLN